MVPQNKGDQKLRKKTIEHYKGQFLNTQKVPFMLFFLLSKFNMICRTLDGAPITF
jgi:hypothetical protein